MILQKEKWLNGKRFVYSITYDEGFVDLLENTVPVHERFGFPGQLGMVVGQIGQPRNVPGSSWNGKLHMNVAQIRECQSRGWGVSSHSMTHGAARSMYADPYTEVATSRDLLQQQLGVPVTSFIVPYDNENHPPVVSVARDCGYLAVFTLTDDVNDYGTDRYALYRSPLVEEGFYPFFSRLDPYLRLHQAREAGGWVVDYTHLTNPVIVAPTKEISQSTLIRRFQKVREVGGDDVWVANCDEVVDYMLLHSAIEVIPDTVDAASTVWRVRLNRPPQVTRRMLTFSVDAPGHGRVRVSTDPERRVMFQAQRQGQVIFTLEVTDGLRISLSRD